MWRYEVWRVTEKHQYIEAQQKPYLKPSVLAAKSKEYFKIHNITNDTLTSLKYWEPGRSVELSFALPDKQHADIYLDPYTGKILKDERERSAADNFFIFVVAKKTGALPSQI